MDINIRSFTTDFKGEKCFTHARGVFLPNGKIFITTQPLQLDGVDVFYCLHYLTVDQDFNRSEIKKSKVIDRETLPDGNVFFGCDFTPFYYQKKPIRL